MIESVQGTGLAAQQRADNKQYQLSYRRNDRMAGSIAVWRTGDTAKGTVSRNLSRAENNTQTTDSAPETVLAYNSNSYNATADEPEVFGFGDILDMFNPLHHIPLIGSLYRNVTGDDIKPVSRIIGGAVFGGAAGAGSALVNVIIEEETGHDIAGNVMRLASGASLSFSKSIPDHPEKRLNNAVKSSERGSENHLPGSVLSFVDLGGGKQRVYERYSMDDERTAGTMIRISEAVLASNPVREPITRVKLSPWPSYND